MAKRAFMDGYRRYDPSAEGFGDERQWRTSFKAAMGLDEAKAVMGELTPEMVLDIPKGSPMSVVKSAYRRLSFACHPDRCAIHKLTVEEATRLFRQVQAAYVILEAQHQQTRP